MVVHAKDEKEKKIIAVHIVTGHVCSKCKCFSKSLINPGTGYCSLLRKPGMGFNDYCSLFKKQ